MERLEEEEGGDEKHAELKERRGKKGWTGKSQQDEKERDSESTERERGRFWEKERQRGERQQEQSS